MQTITALIVDDERLARDGLKQRVCGDQHFEVIGLCRNAQEALAAMAQCVPDVLFVDIEMPGLSGIELVRCLQKSGTCPPNVVFVTAFKDFAHQAFAFDAFDYLLKPLSEQRVQQCLNKLRDSYQQLQAYQQQRKLEQLVHRRTGKSLQGFMAGLERSQANDVMQEQAIVTLKSGTEFIRLAQDSIVWIECAGDYLYLHSTDANHIIRKTLTELEQELDSKRFARVNRSAIVNLNKLQRFTPNSNGEYIATLITGEQIKVSRKYKLKLKQRCTLV